MTGDIARRAEAEVVARHAFFVEWFTGRAPQSEMDVSARAFAPDMRMIEPDAAEQDHAAVLAMLQGAKGRRPADFAIAVVMRRTRTLAPDLALVTYDEHQTIGGEKTARRSTAVFSRDEAAPEGVVWRFLQETWIDDGTAP
jgi:hypothetical protein